MNSFQSINSNIKTYLDHLKSLSPDCFNAQLVQAAICQLNDFRESFTALDRHPFKVERITERDIQLVVRRIDRIGDLFVERMNVNPGVVTICNAAPLTRSVLYDLLPFSQMSNLQTLGKLSQKLDELAADVSTKISRHVEIYRNGPLTAFSAQETLAMISTELDRLGNQLRPLPQALKNLKQTMVSWIKLDHQAPKDVAPRVLQDTKMLFETLLKISNSLMYEAENIHSLYTLLHFTIIPSVKMAINKKHCPQANALLDHFQQMDGLARQIKAKLDSQNSSPVIILYNICRLEEMRSNADMQLELLPKTIKNALEEHQQNEMIIDLLSRMKDNPDITLETRNLSKKRCDEYLTQKNCLEYSQTHIDELRDHPLYVDAQQLLYLLCTHPLIYPILEHESFPSPLLFESNSWILQSVQLQSIADLAAFYQAITTYSQKFFPINSLFLGKSSSNQPQNFQSPWSLLIDIEMLSEQL